MAKHRYDIFISYRRDGGYETAHVIKEKLERKGYRVFFDIESLRSGLFNEQLYNVIDNCKDFILILPPKGLDRCHNENGWVRKEVLRALEKGKNIIPVMLSGFEWPDAIPEGMEKLPLLQAVTPLPIEYSEQRVAKIISYLKSRSSRCRWLRIVVAVILSILALDFCTSELIKLFSAKEYQKEASEIIHKLIKANQMVEIMKDAGGAYQDAYFFCQSRGDTSSAYRVFRKNLDEYDRKMRELGVSETQYVCCKPFIMQLRGFTAEDLEFIHGQLYESVYDKYCEWSEAMRESMAYFPGGPTFAMSNTFGELVSFSANRFCVCAIEILSHMGRDARTQWYDISHSLHNLPYDTPLGQSSDFYHNLYMAEDEKSEKAMSELDKYVALVEQSYSSMSAMDALGRSSLEAIAEVGKKNQEAMADIKAYADRVSKKSDAVRDLHAQLDSVKVDLQKTYQSLKETCRFTEDDDKWTKWTKVTKLATALEENVSSSKSNVKEFDRVSQQSIYSDISLLLDIFASQYPEDKTIVESARAYYREWLAERNIGLGVIVWMTKDNLPHPVLRPGDIVLQRRGVDAVHTSDVTTIASGPADDPITFLRLESGSLVRHTKQWQKSEVLVAYSNLRL